MHETEASSRAPVARPSAELDFWPAADLDSWREAPLPTFTTWLAQQSILGKRAFRETSVDTYAAMFSTWVSSLEAAELSILEATAQDASRFFEGHRLEPVSRRRYLQLLDKVYRHLRQCGWKGSSPVLEELQKETELVLGLPPGLKPEQLFLLYQQVEGLPGWKGCRDRAIVALTVGAGLRVNELIAMRTGQVSAEWSIDVRPNGVHREHRTIVLPDGPWRGWLHRWFEARAEERLPGEVLLPAAANGKAFTPSGLFRRVRGWLEAAAIQAEQSGPNILRNSFAREALRCSRYSLEEIQGFLGHVELRATNRHLMAIEGLKNM